MSLPERPLSMHLYNVTLVAPSAVTAVCVGNFSPISKEQLILTCRGGSRLELGSINKTTGKYAAIMSAHGFGTIRSLTPFRLTGGTRDYVVVGSDSGRIVVLEFDPEALTFRKIHQETYGKSGSRRIVAGQYITADPKGRAIMIGAVEKSKIVYILNRDQAANLTISSPLEANKLHAIIHSIVALDVGFENPLFAAIEVDYTEVDQDPTGEAFNTTEKMLTYYELDLGLNHVVRKWSEPTDQRANLLIALPGGQSASSDTWDGPSGVLVCCENQIIYRHQGVPEHRVPIPRRETPLSDPDRGIIITSGVVHKMRGDFFVLLQSEEGDLFKLTVDRQEEEVIAIKIKYFDTVPLANQLVILRSGFLFVASEFGNQLVYQFDKLGEDGDEVASTDYPNNGAGVDPPPSFFRTRPLENLIQVDDVDSLAPIIDARAINVLGADAPQIITASGRGARSSMRMIRHGLDVEEMVGSPLGFAPTGVWATKLRAEDEFDSYIVLSAPSATYVLSIGESIEQVNDSGLVETSQTLGLQQLGEDSIVQVHTSGFIRLRGDGRREPWPEAPQRVAVACATTNRRQIVLATTAGELIYFAVDNEGELNEYMERKALGAGVSCMSIAEVAEGHQRTPYLAVGCEDQTVRIVSLDPDTCMDTISIQALTAQPSSICMLEMLDAAVDKVHTTLFVNIGLQNGVLLRTVLDTSNGQLADTRTRFLGSRPVKLRRANLRGSPSLVALSSRTWLNYTQQGLLQFDPLIFDPLDHACALSAEVCPEGIIGITGDVLRLFTLPKLGNRVKLDTVSLTNTPRRFAYHPSLAVSYVIETDHRSISPAEAASRLADVPEGEREAYLPDPAQYGLPRAPAGTWVSSVRVVDSKLPSEGFSLQQLFLDNNEAAFSIAVVPFSARNWDLHLVVGTAQDTTLAPKSCTSGFLRTYAILDEGRRLELLHKTELDDVPTAIMAFQGKLIAGVGRALRLYEIGKKKLLRKAETKTIPTAIMTLNTQGSRIIVGDLQDSIHYAVYKAPENRLIVVADDPQPRWITCSTMVDYLTVAAGDKFGNVFLNRINDKWSDEVDGDSTGAGLLYEKSFLNGAPRKTEMLAHFHVGDVLTSIQRAALVAGGREVLMYTGFSGTIGALIPFTSSEDVEFFQTLEMHMRTEMPSLVGRDHMSYRGYNAPCKAVIDGDLCELYARLPVTKQAQIAQELDRTLQEVARKIDTLRGLSVSF